MLSLLPMPLPLYPFMALLLRLGKLPLLIV
uniref:Uncharacterized protein n=1 Tax=Picea sitchensis TaxID=3332 RepID=A0A6B9XZ62_PICSI|nr:hypothetical protein Q903MT_gene6773 [Picea sitchensis]